ncbi:thiamine phosphate synthase [Niallia sp. NCCP-28]|uniref:thiamine phosphate synthase n=1 Tax=Niallia sp. NCCP-28 TaxID=2934712 RepID=UPI00207DA100|nr:thiamine phosphate synthase [Niallia sp. NCCP-28]GKU80764.1 thiamine-phosphate synthase [Niallia sp. NCCP-28]
MSRYSKEWIREKLKVYFIMGSNNTNHEHEFVLTEALKGGVTIFQFREKGDGSCTGKEKIELARRWKEICDEYQVPFIINDDVDLAIEIDADGVHIGQEDESPAFVKKKIGDRMLGVSAHTVEEVEKAIAAGADYVGIGPIFPTNTKKDAKKVQGTKLIQELKARGIDLPIVGIGGITSKNAKKVMDAGGDGVAVISEISYGDSPFHRAKQLEESILV